MHNGLGEAVLGGTLGLAGQMKGQHTITTDSIAEFFMFFDHPLRKTGTVLTERFLGACLAAAD